MKKNILFLIKKINFLSRLLFHYDLYKYLNHHKWIWKIFKVKVLNLTFLKSTYEKKNEILMQQIQKEYLKDIKNFDVNKISSLWKDDIKKFSKKNISHFFLNHSSGELLKIMNELFRTDYVYGLSTGGAFKYQNSFFGKKIWSLKYYDLIISLCEYFAYVRLESPAQGDFGNYINEDIQELIKKLEISCNFDIGFPNIGSPYGICINDRLITFENLEHLYAAERTWEYINLFYENNNKKINIVEIGGGYGGLARNIILKKTDLINSYTLVDLPLMIAYQKYFLKNFFNESKILDKIKFVTHDTFSKENNQFDIMINQNSFPEMTADIVRDYLEIFSQNNNGSLLISFNHEAISKYKGKFQVALPEIINDLKIFKKIIRNLSWVREGYAENVYKIQR
jgi:putative sugar O-methyltransferase